jgi:hypothetical protein
VHVNLSAAPSNPGVRARAPRGACFGLGTAAPCDEESAHTPTEQKYLKVGSWVLWL